MPSTSIELLGAAHTPHINDKKEKVKRIWRLRLRGVYEHLQVVYEISKLTLTAIIPTESWITLAVTH